MNKSVSTKIESFLSRAKQQVSTHKAMLEKAEIQGERQDFKNALSNRLEMYKIGQDLAEILIEVIEDIESDKRKSIYEATSDGGFTVVNIDREDPDEMDEEAIFNRFRSR